MPDLLIDTFGPDARVRFDETTDPGRTGALAALETFYAALNQRDLDTLVRVWPADPLAQLNNPVGGILRGTEAIADLYDKVFHGRVRLTVTFGDIVEYLGADHAVFAGRETAEYAVDNGPAVPITFRTTRYLRYHEGRWLQFHHHGSVDDPKALAAYQAAVRGEPATA
ncbi:YybH family protein [Kribbella sp. CA-253562]|uniref:YybH family protein n=1 Tax=Kribbella sp. CA-253562 TaxID=3239942 RepID=UPI003D94A5C4